MMDLKQVKIIYKNIKNINLRVKPSGEVILSAPKSTPKSKISKILSVKEDWIKKHLNNFKENIGNSSKNSIKYLGQEYEVELKKSIYQKVVLRDSKAFIYLHDVESLSEKDFVLDEWYIKNAKEIFNELIEKWQKVVQKEIKAVRIKKMKTRWGSCNHQKRYINLNLNLIKYPKNSIEYVILHELTHLIHPNHSKDFYNYIAKYMPDYKEREKYFKYK